ncbi:MAG: hypothetical protein AB7W59_15515 [Acidimicrobiia bacterium]
MMGCRFKSKIPHLTQRSAQEHLDRLKVLGDAKDYRIYKCDDHWHVGNKAFKPKKVKR